MGVGMTEGKRTAIVTGASGGLGAAYAEGLAADGIQIAIVDIKPADAVVEAVEKAGGTARAYLCDITDPDAVNGTVKRIAAELGGIDVLVNNAGIYDFTPHETVDFALWRRMMALNVDGMFLMTQAVIPAMKEKGWGRIICVASNSCFLPPPGLSAYVATKSAVLGYVKSLSGELGQYGITVNAVAPGPTVTDQLKSGFPNDEAFYGFMEGFVKEQAVKKVALPEYSTPVVSFLAGDGAAFVTGQTIVVDGGWAKH